MENKQAHVHMLFASSIEASYDQMKAKAEFFNKAKEVQNQLFLNCTTENREIKNKIFIKFFVILKLLENKITLSTERIKFYTCRFKNLILESIEDDQWHSIVSEMEIECGRAIDGEEVLSNLKKQIDIAQSNYDLAKKKWLYAKDLKEAGLWSLMVGGLSSLFVMGVSALIGNAAGVVAGLSTAVATIITGGGITIEGIRCKAEAKKNLEKTKKHLDELKSEYSKLDAEIQKKALNVIKEEEEKYKKKLEDNEKKEITKIYFSLAAKGRSIVWLEEQKIMKMPLPLPAKGSIVVL